MTSPEPLSAEYFDDWYAAMARSPVKDEVVQRHLGLPPELLSSGTLPAEGFDEVLAFLAPSPEDHVLDLACGRGGYALEAARRSGARVTGVDFSAEAVRQAALQAGAEGIDADFRRGSFEAIGLGDDSVDAAMCLDSVQFATVPAEAMAELRRVVRAGGRVALTCWEATDPEDPALPPRIRAVRLATWLSDAGFLDVVVADRPLWRAAELAMWREAAALDPGDDEALRSFHEEGARALLRPEAFRRVLATAVSP